jgi:signal transduction histidine kinase
LLKSINYSIERHKIRQAFSNTEKQKTIEISNAVINAQEKERLMLSSELHDNINQILACSSMFLGMAELKNDKKKEYIKQANELLQSAITEIRELSHSLAPPNFKGLGFEPALNKLVDKFRVSSGILVKTEWENDSFTNLSEKMLLNVFRIIQEQLNNINKHAKAKSIEITISRKQKNLCLNIKDDGIGFDSTKQTNGIGIYNIKTRASLFNGHAEFITAPLNGCVLNVVLTDLQNNIL